MYFPWGAAEQRWKPAAKHKERKWQEITVSCRALPRWTGEKGNFWSACGSLSPLPCHLQWGQHRACLWEETIEEKCACSTAPLSRSQVFCIKGNSAIFELFIHAERLTMKALNFYFFFFFALWQLGREPISLLKGFILLYSILLHHSASPKSHLSAHILCTQHERSGGRAGHSLLATNILEAANRTDGSSLEARRRLWLFTQLWLNWRSSCKGKSWEAKVNVGSRGRWSGCERHPC